MATELNPSCYCRTCAKNFTRQPLVPLYKSANPAINAVQHFQNTNFTITLNDGLPQQICSDCLNKFNVMNDFLEVCEKSQKFLESIFVMYDCSKSETESHSNIPNKLPENYTTLSEYIESSNDNDDTYEEEFLFEEYMDEETITSNDGFKEISLAGDTQSIHLEIDSNIENDRNSNIDNDRNSNIDNDRNSNIDIDEFKISTIYMPNEIKSNGKNPTTDQMIEVKIEKLDDNLTEINQIIETDDKIESELESIELEIEKPRDDITLSCNYCPREFKTMDLLKTHEKLRHRNKQKTFHIMCEICGDVILESEMPSHKNTHLGITNHYECEHCHKKFANFRTLKYHTKVKHYITPKFHCEICGRGFILEYNLKNHMKLEHSSNTAKPKRRIINKRPKAQMKCLYCSKCFYNTVSLVEHCKTHRKPEPEDAKHVCNFCQAVFKRADHLKIHVNTQHLKSEEFQCTVCSKIFYASFVLNRHMKNKHSSIEKPARVICDYCNKSLSSKEYLQRHISEFHSNEKNVKCPLCEEKFNRRVELKAHSKVHDVIINDNHKEMLIKEYCGDLIKSNISQRGINAKKSNNDSNSKSELEDSVEMIMEYVDYEDEQ